MKNKTFLFYDIETTGLNYVFDQVLQFAAIRTDSALKELTRHEIKVKLRPDVICSPGALLTHRISVAESLTGTCEFEATQEIHSLLNEPGTISLGYNTLGFDDEFLRFSFYRNLLPPYTHQYANGCGRTDLYPLAAIYRLYKNEILKWPEAEGKPSLKLANLNAANNLAQGQAHDALVDVEATVGLARILARETEMWNYLLTCFNKKTDEARIAKLPHFFQSIDGDHRLGIMVNGRFGATAKYQAPVISIGDSVPYTNQNLWMRLDLPELQELTSDTISDFHIIRKRYGEPGIILPPYERFKKPLVTERRTIVDANKKWLLAHPKLFHEFIHFHRNYRYPIIPDLDADAALYQLGFPTANEKRLQHAFHKAPLSDKADIIPKLPRPETRDLAIRVIARNYPQALPQELSKTYKAYKNKLNPSKDEDALLDYKGNKRATPAGVLAEIEQIKTKSDSELDEEQLELMNDLASYIESHFK
ncbi:exonuclease domain-containing protein [Desulfococcaceae bacterium HSG7]|nr:exonuclease domain-containing protein [Desulfococcaceae bacterium HSG7]